MREWRHRRAVGGDVVHDDGQLVVVSGVAEPMQRDTDGQIAREVEWTLRQRFRGYTPLRRRDVLDVERDVAARGDHRCRQSVTFGIYGAQRLVAGDHPAERAGERVDVECASQVECEGDRVRRVGRIVVGAERVEEPELPLSRSAEHLGCRIVLQEVVFRGCRVRAQKCELRGGRMIEDVAHGQA
ncbi:Uncharacterised protein [Mycobacteroides abscessus subsp. abscessus]|nr:Uncharacterised protein [Mycobacteroides abscessus subsp. abscessus]